MTTVEIKRLDHGMGLELPSYATRGSAGVDLRAANEEKIIVNAGMRILVSTGIAIALEEGYEAQIRPRSGLAVKFGITVLNSPGTIDSDYRGEIKVCLINLGQGIFTISRGDRIAQMVINPISQVKFIPSKELSATERGKGGLGSTGNE